jgi:tetratricopeptide (TPR) repeat protein
MLGRQTPKVISAFNLRILTYQKVLKQMIEAENGRLPPAVNRPALRWVLGFEDTVEMTDISLSFASLFRVMLIVAVAIPFTCVGFIEVRAQDETQEDPVAIFNQAQDLHEKGDLAGAVKLYEKALKIEPAFPEAEYQRGTAELALGKTAEAEKAFRRAIELREGWTLPMTSLGSLLINKGETAEAERLLAKAVELEPHNGVALSALTELKVLAKSAPAELESLLSKVTNLTGKANATVALWTARAALENALQRRAAAKTSLSKALAIDPTNRSAIFLFANISLAEGDINYARDLATRVSAPPSDQEKLLRASILAADGDSDGALKALDAIEKPGKAASELRSRLNTARQTSPAELEKQLDASPKDAAILGRLCNLFRRDNPSKALEYCRRASEAEPDNPSHAIGFGAALVQGKQFETAVQIFRKILQIVPDNATARANLATALFQLKRYPEARIELQWLIETQPRSPGPYLFLGIVFDETGEYMDAMANYQLYLKYADPAANKLDIEKVNLRLPGLQKLINSKKK